MKDQEILQKLKMETMPKEVQEQLLNQVNQVVELRVAGLVDDVLSEKQRATFEKKAKEGPETVWKWLNEQFPDLAKLYQAALEDYLEEVTEKTNNIL